MPAQRPFNRITPRLGERVFIDPACTVIGDVHIGDDSSIWPGTIIRGDVNHIRIGARTNIQDGSIIHVSHDGPSGKPVGYPTLIGDDVTQWASTTDALHLYGKAAARPGRKMGHINRVSPRS